MRVVAWRRRRGQPSAGGEDGFSIIETALALGLIFTVLVGLLASLSTGVRGLMTGRHRTSAVAVAKEVIEEARAATYDALGHSLNDPQGLLAADPDVTGLAPDWQYHPEGVASPESLVGGVGTPTYDVHRWSETLDNATYAVRVYVTAIAPLQGDDYKRLTIVVEWDESQNNGQVSNEIRVSTLVSPYGVVSGSEVKGVTDVDSGTVSVTGTLSGVDLSRSTFFFPSAHADADDDGLVRATRGYAGSARSELLLNSGSTSGCAGGTCTGVKAETAADNDGGTALPIRHALGPVAAGGETVSGDEISLTFGAGGVVDSKSAGEASVTHSPIAGDVTDGLVYGANDADGPSSMSMAFAAGIIVDGGLVDIDSAGSAVAAVDADAVGGDQKFGSTGRLVVPAVDVVTLGALAPLGYTSGVSVSAVDVTAASEAGPTAAAPSVTGDIIRVTMYDTGALGLPKYRTVSFAPGQALSGSADVTFDVVSGLITSKVRLQTTVTAGTASTESQSSGGNISSASASLSNWFVVRVRLTVVQLGSTLADLTIELDYGRLATSAGYQAT